jgi:hypothetical protein
MSNKSKLAVIAAAAIGVVVTQSSSLHAETEQNSAPEKLTKIAAPINANEDVFYSAIPDDALERAAGFAGMKLAAGWTSSSQCCSKVQPVKKPPTSQSKKTKQ